MLKKRCVDLKAWLFVVSVSTHLSDVPHLILKVTDRPLTCHHLLLFVWAHPLHNAIHFGPMMLQRGLWRPIGHFTEVLRETGSPPSGQVSAHTLHRGWHMLSLCLYLCACLHTCTLVGASHVHEYKCLHIYSQSGISSTSAAEHWKQEPGNNCLKKKKSTGCTEGVTFLQPSKWAAVSVYCTSADGQPVQRDAQQRCAALKAIL